MIYTEAFCTACTCDAARGDAEQPACSAAADDDELRVALPRDLDQLLARVTFDFDRFGVTRANPAGDLGAGLG
jgi:hypothetical protein